VSEPSLNYSFALGACFDNSVSIAIVSVPVTKQSFFTPVFGLLFFQNIMAMDAPRGETLAGKPVRSTCWYSPSRIGSTLTAAVLLSLIGTSDAISWQKLHPVSSAEPIPNRAEFAGGGEELYPEASRPNGELAGVVINRPGGPAFYADRWSSATSQHSNCGSRVGAIQAALATEDLGVMCQALDCEIGIDSQDGRLRTPLYREALEGNDEKVRMLLACGAQVELPDDDGRTALHAAAFAGHARVVKRLLRAGARSQVQDHTGRTPLHTARTAGIACQLIQAGADVDAPAYDLATPLHEAARWGNPGVACQLLDCGADATAIDSMWRTPFQLATSHRERLASIRGYMQVAQLLAGENNPMFTRYKKCTGCRTGDCRNFE